MSTAQLVSLAIALVARSQAPSQDTLLAKIPSDLRVARDLLPRSNRGAFAARASLAWSSDGRAVAYAGRRGDEWFPVVGAKVGASYSGVSRPVLAGGHVFFHVGRTKTESTEEHWLWIDGESVGPEDWMGDLAVSADGKRVAYWTWPGAHVGNGPQSPAWSQRLVLASESKGGQWNVRRSDGKWNECGLVPPLFVSDGERVVACAVGKKGWIVFSFAGAKESPLSDEQALIDSLATSASGAAIAFVRTDALGAGGGPIPTEQEHAELYFKGKRVGPKLAGITQPTVDSRGEHVACVVTVQGGRSVAVDGEVLAGVRFDHVLELAFDPTGKKLAFVANRGGAPIPDQPGVVSGGTSLVVVATLGSREAPAEHKAFVEVRDLVWDAAGARLAYCAREGERWRAVCGQRASETHDDVGAPHFSADGRAIAFGTRDGSELWWRTLALE